MPEDGIKDTAQNSKHSSKVMLTSTLRSCLQSKGCWLEQGLSGDYYIKHREGIMGKVSHHTKTPGLVYVQHIEQVYPGLRAELAEYEFDEPGDVTEYDIKEKSGFRVLVDKGHASDDEIAELVAAMAQLDREAGCDTITPCVVVCGKQVANDQRVSAMTSRDVHLVGANDE